jgi:hypothetical protein
MTLARLWRELTSAVDGWPKGPPEAVADRFQTWLQAQLPRIPRDLVDRYELRAFFLDLDLSLYPVAHSYLDRDRFADRVHRVQPTSMVNAVAAVAELVWDLVTVETPLTCGRCGAESPRPLLDPETGTLVLSCATCGYLETLDGEEWTGNPWLIPAPTDRLGAFLD